MIEPQNCFVVRIADPLCGAQFFEMRLVGSGHHFAIICGMFEEMRRMMCAVLCLALEASVEAYK